MRKTLGKVRQKYYWAGLYTYVEQYVRSCDICSRGKQAHEIAREHIQTEMRRQKRYHDNKLFWENSQRVMKYMYSFIGTMLADP